MCICAAGNIANNLDPWDFPIPMPPKGLLAQPCLMEAYQAQPQAMQGIHMSPWLVQDSQAQLHMPQGYQGQPLSTQGYQGQPLSAQGYQAQPLPAQGCPAQLQGILTGKAEGSAELFNRALADWLEPDTPEQFEAELFGGMFGPPPAS